MITNNNYSYMGLNFSDKFNIQNKSDIDFFDIFIDEDSKAFICPFKINNNKSKISKSISRRMKSFFEKLNNDFIKINDRNGGIQFLSHLHEPNEIHLGYSSNSKGKAIEKTRGYIIYDALYRNRHTNKNSPKGSLSNESHNILLLIEGIGQDIMSDLILNVCRDILSEYTLKCCNKFNIPISKSSIEYYNSTISKWEKIEVELPFYKDKKIILIPNFLISKQKEYTAIYNRFIAKYYIAVKILNNKLDIQNRQDMIYVKKDGTQKPIIKKILEKYGRPKNELIYFANEYTDSLDKFSIYLKDKDI